jgi:hypothetical protein
MINQIPGNIQVVKLLAYSAVLSGKEIYFILCPFLPAGRDPAYKAGLAGTSR